MSDASTTAAGPLRRFHDLFARAGAAGVPDPTAMALATADASGRPSVRMVLLKEADERGFTFYTNLESRKGGELAANPVAALCFHWHPLEAQVRVEGRVEPVTEAEADAYFASRPRESQIGAWASRQSATLSSRAELEERIREVDERFRGGEVPRPAHWSGFRVVPERIEFWTGRPGRLHDREIYRRTGEAADAWAVERLYP